MRAQEPLRNLKPLKSIGAKILLATAIVGTFLIAYGAWSVMAISNASAVVKNTYDRPLQALNYARSANAAFYRARLARADMEVDDAARAGAVDRLEQHVTDFLEDLEIAEERSLSAESRAEIAAIREAFQLWSKHGAVRQGAPRDGLREPSTQAVGPTETDLAQRVSEHFDVLGEIMATDSFLERQRAVDAVERSRQLSVAALIAATIAAVSLSILVTGQIVRPLRTAARAADRISTGDFHVALPTGGPTEIAALLRSMGVMQASIAEMIAREEARRLSAESRLINAIELADAGIALVDADGRLIHANHQLAAFLPQIAEELQPGAALGAAIAHADIDARTEDGAAVDLLGIPGRVLEARLSDGRWLRVARSSAVGADAVLIWTDVTDIKTREETYRIARLQAEAASAAKTRFLANMSHELKTPLNAVIGFSEIIANESLGANSRPEYREYAQYALDGGRRLLRLILDVLDLADAETDTLKFAMEPVDLGGLLASAIAANESAAERAGVRVDYAAPEKAAWVWGEPARLERAFAGLIDNAVKFSSAGGAVAIGVEAEQSFFHVAIVDQGVGMRAEDIPLALSAFEQIDGALTRSREGAGVGLPFARAVIERHGGRITIESAQGQGTTVSVSLLNAETVAASSLSITGPLPVAGARRTTSREGSPARMSPAPAAARRRA